MRYWIFTLLLFVFSQNLLPAQSSLRTGKDYAVFFYVTTYQHGWERLPETKTEVEAIATELEQNFDFQTEIIANPTKQQVLDKIATVNTRNYGKDDQVLFFFSMHGHFQNTTKRGFLIPTDGKLKDPYGASWLSYDDLGSYVALNPSRHVLLALDACYSGGFGVRWKGAPNATPWAQSADCQTKVENAMRYDSRLYFSSGSEEQRTPARSLFASRWLEALRKGSETGIVRTNDLRYYLSAIEYPIPEGGSFTDMHQEGGDFVFVHKSACGADRLPVIDKTADRRTWQAAKAADELDTYKKYRSDFPNGEFLPLAEQRITQLEDLQQEEWDWEAVKQTDTEMAYERFILDYPSSPYREMAEYNLAQLRAKKETYTPVESATTTPADLPGFVFVQGGTFQMGSNDGESNEKPLHSVTLNDFYLHKNEVTFEEYDAYCSATGASKPDDRGWGRGKRPAINVSWNDAIAYCNWRSERDGLQKVYTVSDSNVTANWDANGYRLPTEAEWEYASRSRGKDEKWAGTSTEGSLSGYANGSGKSDGYYYTAPVGSFRANTLGLYDMSPEVILNLIAEGNALGLHDMSGNVWEWCWDWYDTYPSSSQTNPRGPGSGSLRVFRGGSWFDDPADLRCAYRRFWNPVFRDSYLGFRLASSAR